MRTIWVLVLFFSLGITGITHVVSREPEQATPTTSTGSCTSEEVTADSQIPVEIVARKFRIAPLPLELQEFDPRVLPVTADGSPDVSVVTLPDVPAFPHGTRKIAFVQLHDRNCWGVLLAHKAWLRIPFGTPIPVLTQRAYLDR